MTLITNMWLKFESNIFKVPIMKEHTFFWCTCFICVNSFWNINFFVLQHFYNLYAHSCKKNLWIIFSIFLQNRCKKNYHIKNIKYFTQRQIIIWLKLSFHEVFSVSNWFIIIYYFNLCFSFFPKFCVFFNASLSSSVGAKTWYLIPLFFSMVPSISSRNK